MRLIKVKIKKKDSYATNRCKHYRRDTETCEVGCPSSQVNRGDMCPWDDDDKGAQNNCKCYK